jgi:MFS transporter, FHS family, L-fucose permease
VRVPYALIACIFVVVALLIVTMHLPEVSEKDTETGIDERASWNKVLQQGHLIKGVVAQFLYVGAQVGVGNFVIRFAQHSLPGLTARTAWYYLLGHWIGFMLGRFGGSG